VRRIIDSAIFYSLCAVITMICGCWQEAEEVFRLNVDDFRDVPCFREMTQQEFDLFLQCSDYKELLLQKKHRKYLM